VNALIAKIMMASLVVVSMGVHAENAVKRQRIVVFGASGKIGGVIVSEALARGHWVVAVSRNPEQLSVTGSRFSAVEGDVTDVASFRKVIRKADAIVISVAGNGPGNLPENSTHARAAKTAVAALSGLKHAPYVIQVGGASTMIGDKAAILAAPILPAAEGTPLYGVVFGHLEALNTYHGSTIRWTYIAPPRDIEGWTPAALTKPIRTGNYRTSTTQLVQDANGKNAINVADLAVAVVDEIERRRFVQQRFTVGY
jgi:putative NADH-flavin reductase